MTPLDRLLQEAIPLRPAPPPPWTQTDRDRHWKALCAAVGTPDAQRPTPPATGPHTGTQTTACPPATPTHQHTRRTR